MKKIIITIIIFFTIYVNLYAAKPMIALTGVYSNSHRTKPYTGVIEGYLKNIINSTQLFEIVNPKLLKDELKNYNCLDEKCILRFSKSAKMDILITGKLIDNGKFLILKLSVYGMARPYYGKLIYRYRVKIADRSKFYSRQFGFIYEEHCATFISNFLMKYQMYLKISFQNNIPEFLYDEIFSGDFKLYRFSKKGYSTVPEAYSTIGKISVKNSRIKSQSVEIKDEDFIFLNFKEKAKFLNKFYYGRKKEVVFTEPLIMDTILFMLFTVPVSASMPVMAPIFGYYQNSDWPGLVLWTFNYSPYLYLQVDGLVKKYGDARDERVDFSRDDITRTRFAMYMLFTGGSSLFVDAFSTQYLKGASNYNDRYSFMGNDFTAGYLALIAGGGGMFYRGYRSWGYFYFHLTNILMYYTIKEFSLAEKYDYATGSYVSTGSINKTAAFSFLGTLALVKIIEVFHSVYIRDQIYNGEIIENRFYIEPVVWINEKSDLNLGIKYSVRF